MWAIGGVDVLVFAVICRESTDGDIGPGIGPSAEGKLDPKTHEGKFDTPDCCF